MRRWWTTTGLCLWLAACAGDADDRTGEDPPAGPVDEDADGVIAADDCDDADPTRFPGNPEVCDGVDNDCNEEVDDLPTDGDTFYLDEDEDGVGVDTKTVVACEAPDGFASRDGDCDDDDPTRAPGLDEVCDEVDNDCDQDIDERAIDSTLYYRDADGDSYGDRRRSQRACAPPKGHVDNDRDCDDSNDLVAPGVPDVCDLVDNDCDGIPDLQVVPRDHATLQIAVDTVAAGTEICVAPGAYSDPVVIDGKGVTLLAAGGPSVTSFDLAAAPSLPLVSTDLTEDVVIEGFTVEDLVVAPLSDGAFLFADGSDQGTPGRLTLRGVDFVNNVLLVPDAAREGGLVHVEGAPLTLEDVAVEELTVQLAGTGAHPQGAFLSATGGDVLIDGLALSTVTVTGLGEPTTCQLSGLVRIADATATIDDLDASGITVSLSCLDSAILGPALLDVADSAVSGEDWLVEGTTVSVTSEVGQGGGLISLGGTAILDEVEIRDSDVSVTGQTEAVALPLLSLAQADVAAEAVLEHLTITGNQRVTDVAAGTSSARGLVSLTGYDSAEIRWLDVRANATAADGRHLGGAVYAASNDDLVLENGIVAGNTVGGASATEVFGCGLYLEAGDGGAVELSNVDMVGNESVASALVEGGGLYVSGVTASGPSPTLTVRAVNLSGNEVPGEISAGAAAALEGDLSVDWGYSNAYDNTGASAFAGLADPTGTTGNLAVEPLHTDTTGSDPETWDLTLQALSELVDAGDPKVDDADLTVQDIGAYGGPDGDGW